MATRYPEDMPGRFPGDAHYENLQYLLPQYDEPLGGWSCAREFVADKPTFHCGCPNCLRKEGLPLVFHAEDWSLEGDKAEHWRKRIVSLKTGRLAAKLIVPHYPGYDPGPPTTSDDPA